MKQNRNLGFLKLIVSEVENVVRSLTATSVHCAQPLSFYELRQLQEELNLLVPYLQLMKACTETGLFELLWADLS